MVDSAAAAGELLAGSAVANGGVAEEPLAGAAAEVCGGREEEDE